MTMHEPFIREEKKPAKLKQDTEKNDKKKADEEKTSKKDKKHKKTNRILTRLIDQLKASYTKNSFIERLFYPDNPLP